MPRKTVQRILPCFRYLRSIAYRQFTRMVYGPMGRKRVPLPACAYNAIRSTFPSADKSDDEMTGFVGLYE